MCCAPVPHRLAITVAVCALAFAAAPTHAQTASSGYLTPPKVIVDILDAPPIPAAIVSPAQDTIALLERKSMTSIAQLARPMLRLAGRRIDPRTNGPHRTADIVSITLKAVADGAERRIEAPPSTTLGSATFSPDGTQLTYMVTRDNGVELWVADVATGQARPLTDASLNAAWGNPCAWLADNATVVCTFKASARGAPPAAPTAPTGPNIQENDRVTGPVRTYQDLLQNAHDEAMFEYYFTGQIATVDVATGRRTAIGMPGLFQAVSVSPSGEFVLVARLKRPFSWLVPANRFAKDVEIWNRTGEVVKTLADLPVADTVPIGGVPTGPRRYGWNPTEAATLVWAEAQDGGDPRNSVPHRDRVLTLKAPFTGAPAELARTEYRFSAVSWTEQGTALVRESDRRTRWSRTWLVDGNGGRPRNLWDLSSEDRYADPGSPVTRPGPAGGSSRVILQQADSIYLTGRGASPQGDRPFLDRLDLTTLETERLFQTDDTSYETVVSVLTADGRFVLTRRESRVDPPNYFVRDTSTDSSRALTAFEDPAPQLAGIEKQLVTYERADGVKLSATLYLPPGYQPGQRPPMLLWAYPREFTNPDAAGQVTGSPNRFTTIRGASHLLLLTQGYAILDGPTMPIIGPGETANDTYVGQLVASAAAAIEKVVEMGVADRHRIGIGGHSYGAFMTANLLAHSDLFRAGIARSGAYNRSLTPFGFQNERRTFWEVPETYAQMSPFFHAHKVNEPVLLTHGEVDTNSGTFPIQSRRFYMALKGHGATVRYVTLPHEAHGYAARESVLHTVAEMLNWCNEYVRDAAPRETTSSAAR